jgi:hypothetical protein
MSERVKVVEVLLGDEDEWKIWKEQEDAYEQKYLGKTKGKGSSS